MNYGGNSQDEMQVTLRLDRGDRQAHICSTWPEWSRTLANYIAQVCRRFLLTNEKRAGWLGPPGHSESIPSPFRGNGW